MNILDCLGCKYIVIEGYCFEMQIEIYKLKTGCPKCTRQKEEF